MFRLKRHDGFTLIELLVVMIILGILVAIAVPAYLSFTGDNTKKPSTSQATSGIDPIDQVGLAGLRGVLQNQFGLHLDSNAHNHLVFKPNPAGWVANGDLYASTDRCRVHLFIDGTPGKVVLRFEPFGNKQLQRFISNRQDVRDVLGC